jgi:hypothetical protein
MIAAELAIESRKQIHPDQPEQQLDGQFGHAGLVAPPRGFNCSLGKCGTRKFRGPCFRSADSYVCAMQLTDIQDYAIQALIAQVVGRAVFDRVFSGVRFIEADGALLYVNAKDEEAAAEIEDDFSLLIADIATRLLKQDIDLIVVLPKVLQ